VTLEIAGWLAVVAGACWFLGNRAQSRSVPGASAAWAECGSLTRRIWSAEMLYDQPDGDPFEGLPDKVSGVHSGDVEPDNRNLTLAQAQLNNLPSRAPECTDRSNA
jgi:hypothetical protein